MRRFSTAAAAAILLFTATGFAAETKSTGIDNCLTEEQSSGLRLSGLQCVSCGVQMYYADQGKEINPSEKWLAALGSAARSFRELNKGVKGGDAESIQEKAIAKKNLQQVVISQIQAYNFCTKKVKKDKTEWSYFNKFITHRRDTSSEDQNELAKALGFKSGGWLSPKDGPREDFKNLFNDSEYTNADPYGRRLDIVERRRAFSEKVDQLIVGKRVDDDLRDCLNEMKDRASKEKLTDNQSHALCLSMANACELETDFCGNGLTLTAKPGSGASSQGSQQNPKPIPASSHQPRLAPPPPPYQPVQ